MTEDEIPWPELPLRHEVVNLDEPASTIVIVACLCVLGAVIGAVAFIAIFGG